MGNKGKHSVVLSFTYLVKEQVRSNEAVDIAKGRFRKELEQTGVKVTKENIDSLFHEKPQKVAVYAVAD